MTRNRVLLIMSICALVVVLLGAAGFVRFREAGRERARVERRFPLQKLAYCDSGPVRPCVVSFSQDSDGNMLVSFLTDGAFYPDFYLTVKTEENEHIYVCQKVDRFATSVYCSGRLLPIGTVLQFMIYSINEEVLLAQGNFLIIGIAMVTPDLSVSPTTTVTTSAVTPTPRGTSTPSYPSYPGTRP